MISVSFKGIFSQRLKTIDKLYLFNITENSSELQEQGKRISLLSQSIVQELQQNPQCLLIAGPSVSKNSLDDQGLLEFEDYIYE